MVQNTRIFDFLFNIILQKRFEMSQNSTRNVRNLSQVTFATIHPGMNHESS